MNKIYILYNSSIVPSYNLACEEYFLLHKKESYIIIWRNSPSVIIGRNQNAYREVNLDYANEKNIPVIRRLTGGGAVFHDLGNINYTYIFDGDGLSDLKSYLNNIIEFLNSKNLEAKFSGRNDILIDNKKISGTAQACLSGRCIIHGTLLYSSLLTDLDKILTPNKLKLQSKGISSVKSRVTDIYEHLDKKIPVESFLYELYSYLLSCDNCDEYRLSNADKKAISALEEKKYKAWQWNIGENPKYSIEKTISVPSVGLISAEYSVDKGRISKINLYGDFTPVGKIKDLEKLLCGLSLKKEDISEAIEHIPFYDFIEGCQPEFFLPLFL